MKIAVINHYAGSSRRGMEHRHYDLARHWVAAGHEVHIVAASYSHLRQGNPVPAGAVFAEREAGIQFHYLKTRAYSGNGLGRIWNMLGFCRRLWSMGAVLRNMDVLLVSSPHLFAVPAAQRLARRLAIPLVLEIRDLWPLSLIELLHVSPWHPMVLAMRLLERRAYARNDLIVSILPNGREHYARHGNRSGRVVHIPNGMDLSSWNEDHLGDQHPTLAALKTLREQFAFVVMYLGTLGRANALEPFLQAAAASPRADIAHVLVGAGSERPVLASGAKGKVFFLDPVPRHLVPAALSFADILYIGWNDRPRLYRYGISPNKIMDYMMAAKPVIHAVKAWNDPVAESACGVSIPPGQPQAIIDAVRRLLELSAAQRADMGRKGRAFASSRYDYRVLAQQYLAELVQVIEATRRPADARSRLSWLGRG